MRKGLDFFPLDLDFEHDDKIVAITREHGEAGGWRLILLLRDIYREGYYKPWDDSVAELFAQQRGIPAAEIKALVKCALRIKMFDPEIYIHRGVLTSAGIQKRWLEARKWCRQIVIDARYWCLDLDTVSGIRAEVMLREHVETAVKHVETAVKHAETAAAQVNISKVNISKGKVSKGASTAQRPNTKEVAPDVWITDEEYSRLCAEYPKDAVDGVVDDLSNALGNRYPKDKYRNHYKTVRNWLKRNGAQRRPAPKLCPRCGKPYLGTVCQDAKCGWAK